MTNPTVLITGSTSGIGKATATGLAERGATVLMVARDTARGQAAKADIERRVPDARLSLYTADLGDLDAVRALADRIDGEHDRLDVLINNAAVAWFPGAQHGSSENVPGQDQQRRQDAGVQRGELMFRTNHLAPFLLTTRLLPLLTRSAPARVITVGSSSHRQVRAIPWNDLPAATTYPLSKTCNILFGYELARRTEGTGVTSNCADPGFVRTNLGRHLTGGIGMLIKLTRPVQTSPDKGAATSVYLATAPEVAETSGRCFAKCRPVRTSPLTHDPDVARRLWEISTEAVLTPGQPG
ncbi:SDR family NAD(P)-dependent oxidoreductase [Actinophytocola sp.]|uniref:SDR family NAD(P)-dependent oxidoreductase n=1 Tax=Actinophytocola sp. TaxID=1872138 RepID=UPI002D7F4C94|nr:SDR family NAD(P)-dependent oxidoreductase [Actinophytocola sp.]HET9143847.1 SDR family NAD(P)-dependent oxidoreductase [Actinophytocola sp.]